jgi:hypothetical protein
MEITLFGRTRRFGVRELFRSDFIPIYTVNFTISGPGQDHDQDCPYLCGFDQDRTEERLLQ